MNYHRIYTIIACLFMSTIYFYPYQSHEDHHFDVMLDFAYPVHEVQAMRHDVTQGLYFLQQSVHEGNDCTRALNFLEQADCKSVTRDQMSQDDRDTLQSLLDQINGLIDRLEDRDEHRSALSSICLSLQDKL